MFKLRCKKYTKCVLVWIHTIELITHISSGVSMRSSMLTLDEVRLEGKTVLLRVDFNSPLDPTSGAFLDLSRIEATLPTFNALSKSKVVVLTHQSRPGKSDFTTTSRHSRELQRLLGRPVKFVEDIHGDEALNAIENLVSGDILMLNNVRMDNEEITRKKDGFEEMMNTMIVQKLSSVADAFVNDAFGCIHRSSPSITGFSLALPCIAGRLVMKEFNALNSVFSNTIRPCILVVGGVKIDDSIDTALNMLEKGAADEVWAVGAVANFLHHLSGKNIGDVNLNFLINELGKKWKDIESKAKKILVTYSEKIKLPLDLAINDNGKRKDIAVSDLPTNLPIYDIGIRASMNVSYAIMNAGTVILNGPSGVFEIDEFAFGTIEIVNSCAETSAYVVMGGGHTATIVEQRGLKHKMGHVSTGGGACLNFLAGRHLPGLESLLVSAERFSIDVKEIVENQE